MNSAFDAIDYVLQLLLLLLLVAELQNYPRYTVSNTQNRRVMCQQDPLQIWNSMKSQYLAAL